MKRFCYIVKTISIIYSDKNRKSILTMLSEMVSLLIERKTVPSYYFTSFLYKSRVVNYKNYLSHKECQSVQKKTCSDGLCDVLGNKMLFHEYYEKCSVDLPRRLAYNINEKIIIVNEGIWDLCELTNVKSLIEIIDRLFLLTKTQSFFIKPVRGSCGKGVVKISSENLTLIKQNPHQLLNHILSDCFIFQEEIQQHKQVSILKRIMHKHC